MTAFDAAHPATSPDPSAASGMEVGGEPTVHHVSARKRRGVPAPKMSINLGPMIDVIFNLLIYFVVTANFAVEEGVLTLKLPQGSGEPAVTISPPPSPLTIAITSAGATGAHLTLQNRSVGGSFEQLFQELASLQLNERNPGGAYRPDDPIIIKPQGQVRWQHVVNAFNAAIRAEYGNVSFAQATRH